MATIYMKFGKLEGSVTTTNYEHWIELNSFEVEAERLLHSGAGGNAASAAPRISEITVTKDFDPSSVDLLREVVNGRNTKVTIHFLKSASAQQQECYLEYELTDTYVAKWRQTGLGKSGSDPGETLTLNFTRLEMREIRRDATNKVGPQKRLAWDIAQSKSMLAGWKPQKIS